jgi:hypothetical protein
MISQQNCEVVFLQPATWKKEVDEMRIACLIAVLCALGCSQDDGPSVTDRQEQPLADNEKQPVADSERQQDPVSVTWENVVYVDWFAVGYPIEHPLMCLSGKDFPEGREMAFRDPESGEFVHAVFPETAAAPENLDGSFVLHGHFQGIQNWDTFRPTDVRKRVKVPPEDYQYFVVSSWEGTE